MRAPASNVILVRSWSDAEIGTREHEFARRCWPVHKAILRVVRPRVVLVHGLRAYTLLPSIASPRNSSGHVTRERIVSRDDCGTPDSMMYPARPFLTDTLPQTILCGACGPDLQYSVSHFSCCSPFPTSCPFCASRFSCLRIVTSYATGQLGLRCSSDKR